MTGACTTTMTTLTTFSFQCNSRSEFLTHAFNLFLIQHDPHLSEDVVLHLYIHPVEAQAKFNKHFESSQKLPKSSFVNERFKKYSMLPNELLTFETTNFRNIKYY